MNKVKYLNTNNDLCVSFKIYCIFLFQRIPIPVLQLILTNLFSSWPSNNKITPISIYRIIYIKIIKLTIDL